MNFCFNCGSKLSDKSLYCENCGVALNSTICQSIEKDESNVITMPAPPAKKSKKVLFISILAVLLVSFIIILTLFNLPSSNKQLRTIGLDAILELKYLAENDDCANFIDALYSPVDFEDVRESISTSDYDTPIAIYSIKSPDFEELIKLDVNFDATLWDNLPDNVKEIYNKRYLSGNISQTINAEKGGVEASAFTSVCFASKEYKNLNIKEQITYLYVFEEGTPVVVYFFPSGYVNAYFILTDCDFEDLQETKEFFAKYHYEVKKEYITN